MSNKYHKSLHNDYDTHVCTLFQVSVHSIVFMWEIFSVRNEYCLFCLYVPVSWQLKNTHSHHFCWADWVQTLLKHATYIEVNVIYIKTQINHSKSCTLMQNKICFSPTRTEQTAIFLMTWQTGHGIKFLKSLKQRRFKFNNLLYTVTNSS